MKKIEAIVRKTKFEEVKETLHDAGIEFFSFWEARGVGMARESRVYRGIAYDTSTIERLYLQIVVRDVNLEKTVQAILDSAATGEVGDGKIFISTLDESIRIRTGEKGDDSLYIKD
jgi:nitrogen regulatory protein P-II 1